MENSFKGKRGTGMIDDPNKNMVKTPFRSYTPDDDRTEPKADVITVRLNEEERSLVNSCKKLLKQKKDATVIKQLMRIGAIDINSPSTLHVLDTVFKNKQNNKRVGIVEFEV